MIATPKPGSPRWEVLRLIVECPGELDASAIAAHLWPPPKLSPPSSLADIYARKKEWEAVESANRAKVSGYLRQLGTKGLICECGAPVLADWFVKRAIQENQGIILLEFDRVLQRIHPKWPGKTPTIRRHVRMVGEIYHCGPPTVGALLGKSPDGATKVAYRDLVDWGVIVAPGKRKPTEAGVRLVEGA